MLPLAAVLLAFAALSIAGALTRAPWCDEAYFAEPAYNLLHSGKLATVVVPPSPIDDPKTLGTDRFTFYTLPLHLVLQAGWYAVSGFGIMQLRLLSVLWGLAALSSWFVILRKLSANVALQWTALSMIALDYTFIRAGSEGRMDMMSAALGFLGIALFLTWQELSYTRALFFGCIAGAASVFTHPIGGILATVNLGITILWFSKGRLRWWHVPLAAAPYLAFAAGWGLYIAQDPAIFRAQFFSVSSGRLSAWKQPFHAIYQEFTLRWAAPFGLTAGTGIKTVKSFTLIVYAAGLVWTLLQWRKVRESGFSLLALIACADLFVLCFAEGTKNGAYLIHAIAWLIALAALPIVLHWRRGGAVVFTAVILIQILGAGFVVYQRTYQRAYLPAVAFIRNQGGVLDGSAELGFSLGFQPGLTDDHRLGFYTGKSPALFVMDSNYESYLRQYKDANPAIYRYLTEKLARSRLVFQNSLYKIYED